MEVNNLANIKSAIKRAELNVKQNEKTQLKISYAYCNQSFWSKPIWRTLPRC